MIFDLPGHREKLPLNLEAVIARDCSKVAGEFESIPLLASSLSLQAGGESAEMGLVGGAGGIRTPDTDL
jgi:hypothetical protein